MFPASTAEMPLPSTPLSAIPECSLIINFLPGDRLLSLGINYQTRSGRPDLVRDRSKIVVRNEARPVSNASGIWFASLLGTSSTTVAGDIIIPTSASGHLADTLKAP